MAGEEYRPRPNFRPENGDQEGTTSPPEKLEHVTSGDALTPLLKLAREARKERGYSEPTVEPLPPSEQARFINFIHERLQAGMVDFTPDGIPVEKHIQDAIMLYYRPEAAKEKGIAETPKGNPTDAPPLNDDQQYYLDSLLERTIMAAGHVGRLLPPEPSMHMVVRKLNRAMKQGSHFDPEFVWQMKKHRPLPRNSRPM